MLATKSAAPPVVEATPIYKSPWLWIGVGLGAAAATTGIVLFATMALLPPYLQNLMGYPVVTTGLLMAPRGVGTLVAMMTVGRLLARGVDARARAVKLSKLVAKGPLNVTAVIAFFPMKHHG